MKRQFVIFGLLIVVFMLVCVGSALAASSGTYRGVSWSLNDDGVLTLGNGGTQTMTEKTYGSSGGRQWSSYQVTSVVCNGTIVCHESLNGFFEYHYKMTSCNLSGFDTSNVTNMTGMFYGCSKVGSLDLSNFDTSKVVHMDRMFSGCSSLTTLNLSSFSAFDASVTYMVQSSMFSDCTALTTLILGEESPFHLSDVKNMDLPLMIKDESGSYYAEWIRNDGAYGPYSFSELAANYNGSMAGTWINRKKSFSDFAIYSSGDHTLYFIKTSQPASYAIGKEATIQSISGSSYTGNVYTLLDGNCSASTWTTTGWRVHKGSVESVVVVDNLVAPDSLEYWFAGFENCTLIDIRKLDTQYVTNASYMFQDCSMLDSLDLSNFNLSSASLFRNAFENCTCLNMVILGDYNPFKAGVANSSGGFSFSTLPDQISFLLGNTYNVNWQYYDEEASIDDEPLYGPYSSRELVDAYTSEMAGTWIAVPKEYSAYAVYDEDTSTMFFIRIEDAFGYAIGSVDTLTSVSGGEYTGNVYPVDEESLDSRTWNSVLINPVKVVVVDEIAPATMSRWFNGFSNCTVMDLEKLDTSNVVSMRQTFGGCSKLTTINGSFDVGNVTDMYSMFNGCTVLNLFDVSGWDTGKVTDMSDMFYGCEALPKTMDLSGWDVSNVVNIDDMFCNAKSLKTLNLSNWHFNNYVRLRQGLGNIKDLETLIMKGWKISDGGYPSWMCNSCPNLKTVDMSEWDVTCLENGFNMNYMFDYCSNLETVDMHGGSFKDRYNEYDANTISFHYIFDSSNKKLNSVDMSDLCLAGHINMDSMFYGSPVVTVDMTNCDGSGIITIDMSSMFEGCNSLESVDTSGSQIVNISEISELCYECYALTDADFSGLNVSNAENFSHCFWHCEKLKDINLTGLWNPANGKDFHNMFEYCYELEHIDVADWNMAEAQNLSLMFASCYALTDIDVSDWNTSSVTNMNGVFYNCYALPSIDVSEWDVRNVMSFRSMFSGCCTLESLDLSNFVTQSGDDLSFMLSVFHDGVIHLKEVVLGTGWNFGSSPTEVFPTPPSSMDGVLYTGKWVHKDGTYGPYYRYELGNYYTPSMAGSWVWDVDETKCILNFEPSIADAVGAMSPVTLIPANLPYTVSENQFKLFGHVFDHWEDDEGTVYNEPFVIDDDRYFGKSVTLTAVLEPVDTSVVMQDGSFVFTLHGNETALFDPLPADTKYQVFEETIPNDWVLIQESDSTGSIVPLSASHTIFLNKHQPDLATIQFTGRKLMDEQPAVAGSFTFELWEDGILLQTKSVTEGGFVQFDMLEYDRNDVGIHTYTIKELVGSDETVLYDGHEETITVEVTANTGDDNIVHVYAEVTDSAGTYPDIVFQNWTKPGNLTLQKLVDDLLDGHQNDEFKFRIRFVQENGLPLSEELTYSIHNP